MRDDAELLSLISSVLSRKTRLMCPDYRNYNQNIKLCFLGLRSRLEAILETIA